MLTNERYATSLAQFLKILFLTKRIYTGKDLLIERYGRSYELSAALANIGHEVTGVCFSYYRDVVMPDKGDYVVNWYSYATDRTVISGVAKYLVALAKLVKHYQPDIIIGASDSLHVILAALLGRRHKLPYIVDLYDNFESFKLTNIPLIKQGFRLAVKKADAVSVVSGELKEYVRKKYKPQGKVSVVENAIPAGHFVPMDKHEARNKLNLPLNGVITGTAGALDSSRGIDVLYKSFLALARENSNIHLVLAGRTDKKIPVPEHERVHYLGEINYGGMPLLFNSLDIGIICNKPDAFGAYCFPQKLYEMLACKIPVIAANVGVMKRLFQNYPENLYEPGDVQNLVRAINLQINRPVIPAFEIPVWADQGARLNVLISQVFT